MYIVVSNDKRKPKELEGFQVEQWTVNQFLAKATAEDDDGLSIEEGLWYYTPVLTKDVYDALLVFKNDPNYNSKIIFFRYENDSPANFNIEGGELICIDPNSLSVDNIPTVEIPEPAKPEVKAIPATEPKVQEIAPSEPEVTATPIPTNTIPEFTPNSVPSFLSQHTEVAPKVETQPEPVVAPIPVQAPAPAPAPVVAPVAPIVPETPVVDENANQVGGLKIIEDNHLSNDKGKIVNPLAQNLVDDTNIMPDFNTNKAAKVILFGSSKGGTGKTFTACMCAYWYAKTHPTEKVALADFDIIDGQVAITTNQVFPTVQGFYMDYIQGKDTFDDLYNYHANTDKFSTNLDFYLAPPQDIPEITNNNDFWKCIFTLLTKSYDVVFFDSGIDYMGREPISNLYKIADKIIITSNTSINSVKSVIKQMLTISGQRANPIFSKEDDILKNVNIVLTRVSNEYEDVNDQVVDSLTRYAPIIAAFGTIDSLIYRVQWGGTWYLIDEEPGIISNLEEITKLSEDE